MGAVRPMGSGPAFVRGRDGAPIPGSGRGGMLEVRFHGRGGQGVVILSKLVARLYFDAGKHVKEFPKFGVERRGAPVEGYVRVDDGPIDLACQIYHPDM